MGGAKNAFDSNIYVNREHTIKCYIYQFKLDIYYIVVLLVQSLQTIFSISVILVSLTVGTVPNHHAVFWYTVESGIIHPAHLYPFTKPITPIVIH